MVEEILLDHVCPSVSRDPVMQTSERRAVALIETLDIFAVIRQIARIKSKNNKGATDVNKVLGLS